MNDQIREKDENATDLVQQAHYWRAQHARAVEREGLWKEKALRLEEVCRGQARLIKEQAAKIEALEAKVLLLQQQVFGKKSERRHNADSGREEDGGAGRESQDADAVGKRSRGQQPGTDGHGRKRRENLPTEEVVHELPPADQCCPRCRKPFRERPDTEDSDEIHWEVRVVRRVHRRKKYVPVCDCPNSPGVVTAPLPAKLIPKGMFSTEFWVRLLMEKWLFQRPLHRVRQMLEVEGLAVSSGTLVGGLKRIGDYVQPLYAAILERSRQADHWHMDETRWMVFQEFGDKVGHKWWLWVIVTRETCAYILDPTRSAKVPTEHLGTDAGGILSVDRYSAYKAYDSISDNVNLSYCWSHVRRDFQGVGKGYRNLREWADRWERLINDLFRFNRERRSVRSNPRACRQKDQTVRATVAAMKALRDRELADPSIHEAQRKVLKSLRAHWNGLTIFVDNPDIPMDNNEAERALRNPVVGRKNYYGNGSVWSGMLTAMLFTVFQTLSRNRIDPHQFLVHYFGVCAGNGGRAPEEVDAFLPWNLTAEQRETWQLMGKPP